jgi:threonylcarbamoyladenosine tRNA methylthiotransferase MtaB
MARSEKLCHYLHVPVQSGDSEILDRMNRRYGADAYRAFAESVFERVPDVGLGTDVIVGFPGETDASFERTHSLLESVPFAYFHVFSYSKRYGTKAARLAEQVPTETIKDRSQRLRELSSRKRRAFAERFVGREVEVLFEQKDENGLWTGLTGNYLRVGVASPEPLRNQLRRVAVREARSDLALGALAGRE